MNPGETTTAPPAGGDTPANTTQAPAPGQDPKAAGSTTSPPPIPYERFKEVVDARKASDDRASALAATLQGLQRTLDERLPKKEEPDESVYEDPAEKALKEVAALRADQAATRDALVRQQASGAIDKAVASRTFADPDEVKERLAERWYLSRAHGTAFDAEAEANTLLDRETKRRDKDRSAWATEKDRAAASTRSAAASTTSPPPGEPAAAPPPWGTPERQKWENEGPGSVAAILRDVRAGG